MGVRDDPRSASAGRLAGAIASVLLCACAARAPQPVSPADADRIGVELDRLLFDAYNRCDLERFGNLLEDGIEFYHDQGGLMQGRRSVIDATRSHICGKVRRELVAGSLQTFPLQGIGVVQLGSHRFCEIAAGACGGIARFVNLWRHENGEWRLARVISYDHRAVP
jgi:hypothetical protein